VGGGGRFPASQRSRRKPPVRLLGKVEMSETILDVQGMTCPMPVLKANRALRGLKSGERLRVLATDRASVADFRAFCQETGHALIAFSEENGVLSFVIRRA
jgi:tRNA 2-thiouridine synthesizing protein A